MPDLPIGLSETTAVAIGSSMYVFGGVMGLQKESHNLQNRGCASSDGSGYEMNIWQFDLTKVHRNKIRIHCMSHSLPRRMAGACSVMDEENGQVYITGGRNNTS